MSFGIKSVVLTSIGIMSAHPQPSFIFVVRLDALIEPNSTTGHQESPFGLYYKSFTIVIYDRNNSGQYYKTTILGL